MNLVCLDMEGVLTPEIWIEFAKETGIKELERTTRDEPDYDKLMKFRIDLLRERGLKLKDVVAVCNRVDVLPGARQFLDELRTFAQVIIVSDTYIEFAMPLMEKLGYPTLFCNELEVDDEGYICDYKQRCEHNKYDTVRGLQGIGIQTIAAGDSHNDVGMIQASKAGFFFRTTDAIKQEYPQYPALDTYEELLEAIKGALTK